MISWETYNIDLGRGAGRTSGYVKTYCPKCHENGKPKSDHSLSCNVETGAFKCHRCGYQGFATVTTQEEKEQWMRQQPWFREYTKKRTEPRHDYARPPKARSGKLDPKTVAYFKSRGISEETLIKMRVTDGIDWMPAHKGYRSKDAQGNAIDGANCRTIHFNYYRDGELIATKLRSGDKMFRQAKAGCEQIAYNLDNIKQTADCYIVEGEMDALSLAEIGYLNVISVPDGGADKAMHWLVDYYETHFADKQTIYIAVDNDTVGGGLAAELAKHFDPSQYVVVSDFGLDPKDGHPLKDANECLMALGPDTLRLKLSQGRTLRPEGDADMDKIGDELDELYNNGLPQGIRIGYPNLDNLMRLEKGRLIIITGTPGSGKSQFLDQVAVKMNVHHEWRFSLFSPEMMPLALHMAMLVSKYTGKPFRKDELNPMTYQRAKERVKDAFHFIDPEDYDLDNILNIARYQVRKYGCDALIIDPWNDLTMDGNGITKTDDINTALLKILTFAQRMNVVVFVMAHPSKIGRNKDGSTPEPTLSDISGSIHFYNRADIGIVVVRTKEEDGREYTKIKIQKMRFANLGAVGETYFKYGVGVGRFHPYDPVGDHTEWDERDLLTPNTTQEAMQFQAAAAPSEANVSGFLEQAARQERDRSISESRASSLAMPSDRNVTEGNMHRPTGLETDDDLPFDNNDETLF